MLLALFLRTYRLSLISINFDTYEQLTATRRLLSGEFPISRIYPPGIAIIMAAPMAIFPRTLLTMQAVIICCSVALVAVSYVATRKLTGDALAATLFGLAVACSPIMVYFSRVALFDVINTLCVAVAIFLVPALRGRPLAVFFLYGLFIAVILGIRATNVVLLPALAIYWVDPGLRRPILRAARHRLLAKEALVTAGAVMAGSFVLVLISGSLRQASSTHIGLQHYAWRALLYELVSFSGLAILLVLPAAVLGAKRLWRRGASIAVVAAYVTVAWPLAHAPFPFFENRYMLPAIYFALFLACHGASAVLRRPDQTLVMRAFVVAALLGFGGYQVGFDALMLQGWPDRSARGTETTYRELRPSVRQLADASLVISTHTRGVRDSNPRLRYLDLIDQSIPDGNNEANVTAVLAAIRDAQRDGRGVYYLYSDFEEDDRRFGLPGPGYDVYFSAVTNTFETTELFRASDEKFRIYSVGMPRKAAARGLPADRASGMRCICQEY